MINEQIHGRLREVYEEFDNYCRLYGVDYSIDSDQYNVQGYRLLDCKDPVGLIRHIFNFIKDRWVELSVDGKLIDYNLLNSPKFNVRSKPLLVFSLRALQENQYKYPGSKHTRQQSQHPSSFRRLKTAFTYQGDKMKPLNKKREFKDRLNESLVGNTELTFVEPDILLTQNQNLIEPEDINEEVEELIKTESQLYKRYQNLLENAPVDLVPMLEKLLDKSGQALTDLSGLRRNDTSSS